MKFSIIIPVRTINEYLKESIQYLKKLQHSDFEVIILTDAKESYPFEDNRFRIISTGKVGPGEKRNIGASNASGEVLAFLDDDAYPSKEWLNYADEIFSDSNVYALGAPAMTPLNVKFLEKCSGKILESVLASGGTKYRHIPMQKRFVDDYPSVNLLIRKLSFDAVGGYPIEFWPGEDTKICLDLVKKYKKPFLYDPRPIVYHHRRNIYIPHLKQISRYGQHRGQFARIFPETSRLPSYFVPSLFLLGVVLGPFVSYFFPVLWKFYFTVILFYLSIVFVEVIRVSVREHNFLMGIAVGLGIILTHLVYGYNFLVGLIKKPKLILRGVDKKTGNYLGG
jgi:glycosyltransferase involved in cell wall biosynthesis